MRLTRAIAALALLAACSSDADPPTPATPPDPADAEAPTAELPTAPEAEDAVPEAVDPAALLARGRSVYLANCTACHGPDPRFAGALGPEVADASRELLVARVLRGEYPPGYAPKRDSTLMVPMPHLESEIDALLAYLRDSDEG